MIQEEWQATINTPPNIESFNLAAKGTCLHPLRKVQVLSQLATPGSIDVNSLTSVLLLQTLTNLNSGLMQSATAPPPTESAESAQITTNNPLPPNPMTLPCKPASPTPIPSLSHLTHFLAYAETHLGVQHVSTYQHALNVQGIGQDILADIDEKILVEVGIPKGDIIHLKKGSIIWWNRPEVKCKWSNTSTSLDVEHGRIASPSQKKRIAYKKHYHRRVVPTSQDFIDRAFNDVVDDHTIQHDSRKD